MPEDVAVAETPAYTPKRRPKTTTISKEMSKLLGMPAPTADNRKERKTWAEVIAKRFVYAAANGSFPHGKEIMDRTEGKVADRVAGADGGPIGVDVMLAGIARIYGTEATRAVEATLVTNDDDEPQQLTDQSQEQAE